MNPAPELSTANVSKFVNKIVPFFYNYIFLFMTVTIELNSFALYFQ